MRVLYLSANPTWTESLRLGDELKEIRDVLQWGISFGQASLSIIPEVTKAELERQLLVEKPDIVHFAGHGEKEKLFFSDKDHEIDIATKSWLEDVFRDKNVSVVLISACESKDLAHTLQSVVRDCIGTSRKIGDDEAQQFSKEFYTGLQLKLPVKEAFENARKLCEDGLFERFGDEESGPLIGEIVDHETEVDPDVQTVSQRITRCVTRLDQLNEELWPNFKRDSLLFGGYLFAAAVITLVLYFLRKYVPEPTLELFEWITWEPWPVLAALAGPPIGRLVTYFWKNRTAIPEVLEASERYELMPTDVQATILERLEDTLGQVEDYV